MVVNGIKEEDVNFRLLHRRAKGKKEENTAFLNDIFEYPSFLQLDRALFIFCLRFSKKHRRQLTPQLCNRSSWTKVQATVKKMKTVLLSLLNGNLVLSDGCNLVLSYRCRSGILIAGGGMGLASASLRNIMSKHPFQKSCPNVVCKHRVQIFILILCANECDPRVQRRGDDAIEPTH